MPQAQGTGLKSALDFYTALGAVGPDQRRAEQPALPREMWRVRSYFGYDLEQKAEKSQRWWLSNNADSKGTEPLSFTDLFFFFFSPLGNTTMFHVNISCNIKTII